MSVISLRLNNEEEKLLKAQAKFYDVKVSTLIKKLTFEKLEDEYDLRLIKEFEESGDTETLTHVEMKEKYGL